MKKKPQLARIPSEILENPILLISLLKKILLRNAW